MSRNLVLKIYRQSLYFPIGIAGWFLASATVDFLWKVGVIGRLDLSGFTTGLGLSKRALGGGRQLFFRVYRLFVFALLGHGCHICLVLIRPGT